MLPLSLPITAPVLAMVAAVGVGFGFGFVLERAGFGRSTTLAAQFYLHDMTVFKVMFSAIVTAMIGLAVLGGLGVLDLAALTQQAASFTWWWPMIVGGFLLGVGFIVSGYCPGTSVVAAASGNIDGLFAITGVVVGSVIYTELQALAPVAAFHTSGEAETGWVFLYDLLGISPQLMTFIVAVAAIGCFVGAEVVERLVAGRWAPAEAPRPRAPRLFAFALFGGVAALGLATLIIPTSQVEAASPRQAEVMSAEQLAERVFDQPWTLRILDTRAAAVCAEQRVPGAECTPLATLGDLGLEWSPGQQDLVLVGEGTDAPEAALAYPGQVYAVSWSEWSAWALTAPAPLDGSATAGERAEATRRAGVYAALTGVKQAPPPPTPTAAFVPKKGKGGGGCE